MGFLGISGSSWLGSLGGLAGTMYANSANQASAQASMDFQKEVLQNRNQWAVEDLKKAGLNPILAAGATQSSAAGAQAQNENPGASAASSASQVNAMKLAERQQKNQDAIAASVVDLNSAKAGKERAETEDYGAKLGADFYGATVNNLGASADMSRATVDNLVARTKEISWNIKRIESDLRTAEKERAYYEAKVDEAYSAADKNRAQADLTRAEEKVTRLREQGQKEINDGIAIENKLNAYNIPAAEGKAWFDSSKFGKWYHRLGGSGIVKAIGGAAAIGLGARGVIGKNPIGFR